MAKASNPATVEDATPEISDDLFETYVPESKPGHYDAQVRAMIERDAKIESERPEDYAKGERTVIRLAFKEDEVEKHKRFFQDSAKNLGRTARIHGKPVPQGDGGVMYRFVLRPKQVRKTKATTEPTAEPTTEAAAPVSEDTPESE